MSDNNNPILENEISNAQVSSNGNRLSRRHFVAAASALVAGAGLTETVNKVTAANAKTVIQTNTTSEEAILDQLYKEALNEGGNLVVYAGGDSKNFYDPTVAAFQARFPKMNLALKVDLSKYHDGAIDNQLARNQVQVDVAYLQTIQDFHRWKRQGQLLPYRDAIGLEHVYPVLKDPDGTYVALSAVSFSNVVNTHLVAPNDIPRDPLDYLAPALKGKLVFVYPNDDDAVLFVFKHIIDRYGWSYMDRLLTQDPVFIRGIVPVLNLIGSGQKAATIAGPWSFADKVSGVVWLPPRKERFVSFGETAAIFKKSPHPAAARLFISWSLSKTVQATSGMWPVRTDVTVQGGYLPLTSYNTSPANFDTFMRDREDVEVFRSQFRVYVGDPQGPDPALS
jgi:ABC-type Fe3+ transport system substrate-binding protein